MIYVFDTSSFIVLSHYYRKQFPSLWKNIDDQVKDNKIISVKEVFNEIEAHGPETDLKKWARENKKIFQSMEEKESHILSKIFKDYPKFQNMVNEKARLKGKPVADPFIVVKAIHIKGTVISEESFQKDGIKIPNLCKVMNNLPCLKLKDFMEEHNWSF